MASCVFFTINTSNSANQLRYYKLDSELFTAISGPALLTTTSAVKPNYGTFSKLGTFYIRLFQTTTAPRVEIYDLRTFGLLDTSAIDADIGNNPFMCEFNYNDTLLSIHHDSYSGRKLSVYETTSWSRITSLPSFDYTSSQSAWSPDGAYLAIPHYTSSPYLRIYQTSDWSLVSGTPTLASNGVCCAWSPDGTKLAIGCASSPYLRVYNTSDWSEIAGVAQNGSPARIQFSPDGTYLGFRASTTINVYFTSTWLRKTLITGSYNFAFSPDSNYILAGHTSSPYFVFLKIEPAASVTRNIVLPAAAYGISFCPITTIRTITGTTKDEYASEEAFDLRFYNRPTGELLNASSSGVDGTFSVEFLAQPTSRIQRVVLSSTTSNPILPDLIDRIHFDA